MKYLLITFCTLAFLQMNAQKTCCSTTTAFADLGSQQEFRDSHQEPKSMKYADQEGEWIDLTIPGADDGRAYLVEADHKTNNYLFVFHEWWGLNDHIISETDKWAATLPGVNVMAIDLYDGKTASTRDAASELMQNADESRIRNIIQSAINRLEKQADVATIGWCFGGGWSMQAAIMLGDRAEACVVYYGMPEQNVDKLQALEAPVLGIFAEKDDWINGEVVSEYEKAMDKAGKEYATHWFDADHAFANPSNDIYDEEAAAEAREITGKFLYRRMIK